LRKGSGKFIVIVGKNLGKFIFTVGKGSGKFKEFGYKPHYIIMP
jgi:hypothetical protein